MARFLSVCSKPVSVISARAIFIEPLEPTYLPFLPKVRRCLGIIGLRAYCSASVCSVTIWVDLLTGMVGTRIPFVLTRPLESAESYTYW